MGVLFHSGVSESLATHLKVVWATASTCVDLERNMWPPKAQPPLYYLSSGSPLVSLKYVAIKSKPASSKVKPGG